MKRISSRTTYFNKRIFPVLWFGVLATVVVVGFYVPYVHKKPEPPFAFYIFPVLMAVLGYVLMKKMLFDLADEVYDVGDFLLVKFGDVEDRISFTNIVNVSYSVVTNPKRVTLNLRQKCRFGNEVTFSPIVDSVFKPFQKSPIIEDLIRRVDEAGSKMVGV